MKFYKKFFLTFRRKIDQVSNKYPYVRKKVYLHMYL